MPQIGSISIKLAHFPKDFKVAKPKPLYQKGTKTNHKNFRPISLVPTVSKIFLKEVMQDHIMNYLKNNTFSTDSYFDFAKPT